jgi:hypothetical protein
MFDGDIMTVYLPLWVSSVAFEERSGELIRLNHTLAAGASNRFNFIA